jgi:hypothetical protein
MINNYGKFTLADYDARMTGSDKFTAAANSTTKHYFYFTFDCYFNGVELYAKDSNMGDKLKMYTEYYVPSLDVWKRYKKFGKEFNIYPNTIQNYVLFPATPQTGVRVCFEYTNTGNAEVEFSANFFIFADIEILDLSNLEEGEDW